MDKKGFEVPLWAAIPSILFLGLEFTGMYVWGGNLNKWPIDFPGMVIIMLLLTALSACTTMVFLNRNIIFGLLIERTHGKNKTLSAKRSI